ncbi:MAG: FixH family protein [Thermodesulfovibrionales bacterium]
MRYKILILLVLMTGVMAITSAILIGITKQDLLVEEHPYEAGLEFDKRIKEYSKLGWDIDTIRVEENKLMIRLIDRDKRPVENASVECLVNKCADIHRKNYRCSYIDKGLYKCIIDIKDAGCLDLKVNARIGNNTMSFDRKIIKGQY